VRARNRELFALIPVALLVTAGFTSVLLVDTLDVGNVTLTYGGYFLAICVAAHVLIRVRLPYADPYLFPLVALLAAIGLVVLYRIDESLAVEQAHLFVLGVVLFGATIVFLRDLSVLERYRYLIATAGIILLALPRVPGIGAETNEAFLSVELGPLSFQPAELGKICIVVFLASYLRERREVLIVGARRVLGVTLPPLKHFGPLLAVWGATMVMLFLIRDLGSSLMFYGALLALLYVATNRLSFVVIGAAMFVFGAWVIGGLEGHVSEPRSRARGPARPIACALARRGCNPPGCGSSGSRGRT
jgi:cell division protein FtsW (lipid II flippase)